MPLKVITSSTAAVAIVRVRINGSAALPFLVDTGASRSVLARSVARRLGISTSGSQRVQGVACSARAQGAVVSRWSVGNVQLPAERVEVVPLAVGGGQLAGLIGSDVLSKFGAIAINYASARLELGSPAIKLPASGTQTVALKVASGSGGVLTEAPISINGHGPFPFVVDSGAAASVIATSVATRLALPLRRTGAKVSGVACQAGTSTATVSRWSVGSLKLPGQKLIATKLTARMGTGFAGLLGSGTLRHFGVVELNYARQQLDLARHRRAPAGGVVRLRLRYRGQSVAAVVLVKIDGRGPFPFALDTGASRSVIDRRLARQLNLHSTGASARLSGVIATARAQLYALRGWSVGGIALPVEQIPALRLHSARAAPGHIDGLLGSNTLRHFGQITLEYSRHLLRLGRSASGANRGPAVPLNMISSAGAAQATVLVRIGGGGPYPFILDTGAGRSVLARPLAQRLGLRVLGSASVGGVNGASRAEVVAVRQWKLGSVRLPAARPVALPLAALGGGVVGLLGSDVLRHFRTITIEFRRGRLFLRRSSG